MSHIKRYNLVNESNIVKPNYDVISKETYFVIRLGINGELNIIGEKDSNYIVWCSLTSIYDKEINKEIFDYVANTNFEYCTQLYKTINNEKFKSISSWYCGRIIKSKGYPQLVWDTMFNIGYGHDIENHGRYFSNDIILLYDKLIERCEYRCYGNTYYDILSGYLKILRNNNDSRYYTKIKELIVIIESESYMNICQVESIRLKYVECCVECSNIYNRYMTSVR